MNKYLIALLVLSSITGPAPTALAAGKADIKVMTQNQYLGADLGPIIGAETPGAYAQAVVDALQSIAANNFRERAGALAESIHDRQPHLVAMQEVFAFECIDVGYGACAYFEPAFNDHLELVTEALASLGSDYYVAAQIRNLTIPTPTMEANHVPGLPVFLPGFDGPAMFISVIDRDVILARSDVPTNPVRMACERPGVDGIGCNYVNVASVMTLAGPITIERGHVAVDAWVGNAEYRYVNTHLEVRILGGNPLSAGLQAAQASELNFALAVNPSPNPASRLIVAGDINSAPTHEPVGPFIPPYRQLAEGLSFLGIPAFAPMTDTWTLRPGRPAGYTCCEAADLSNGVSAHDERIDVVFARPSPASVKANVMDAEAGDKTLSGLWPSDHASVIAELSY